VFFKDKNLKAYDKSYYERQSHMRNDYYLLAQWIDKNIQGKVFGDVGCGEGYLIEDLHNKFGKEVWGVDGSPAFKEFVDKNIQGKIRSVDLTKKHKLAKSDVAISMEVGEHLPSKSADTFVDNIVSTQADVIVFTAAPPGQNGTNHINLQPPAYWEEKFNQRGYTLNKAKTSKFKKDLKNTLKHAWWYVNNIIILERK
jgi:cyclopropane fatty-acyl-phospholipid synthase-like methyltransferase